MPKMIGKLKKMVLKALKNVFGYGEWHISPINERQYAIDIVKWIGDFISMGTIVEIGCGIGEIIGNIKGVGISKYGYDINCNNVVAAQFFHKDTHFICGGFESVKNKNIEVLILVNFIHGIEPAELKTIINKLINENRVKYFVIDIVSGKGYRYKHNGSYLLGEKYKRIYKSKNYRAAENGKRWVEIWKEN